MSSLFAAYFLVLLLLTIEDTALQLCVQTHSLTSSHHFLSPSWWCQAFRCPVTLLKFCILRRLQVLVNVQPPSTNTGLAVSFEELCLGGYPVLSTTSHHTMCSAVAKALLDMREVKHWTAHWIQPSQGKNYCALQLDTMCCHALCAWVLGQRHQTAVQAASAHVTMWYCVIYEPPCHRRCLCTETMQLHGCYKLHAALLGRLIQHNPQAQVISVLFSVLVT